MAVAKARRGTSLRTIWKSSLLPSRGVEEERAANNTHTTSKSAGRLCIFGVCCPEASVTSSVLIDVFCVVFLADGPRARPGLRMCMFVRARGGGKCDAKCAYRCLLCSISGRWSAGSALAADVFVCAGTFRILESVWSKLGGRPRECSRGGRRSGRELFQVDTGGPIRTEKSGGRDLHCRRLTGACFYPKGITHRNQ